MTYIYRSPVCGPFDASILVISPYRYPHCAFLGKAGIRYGPGKQYVLILHLNIKQAGVQHMIGIFQVQAVIKVRNINTTRCHPVYTDMTHFRIVIIWCTYLLLRTWYDEFPSLDCNHPACSFTIPALLPGTSPFPCIPMQIHSAFLHFQGLLRLT